MMLRAMLPLLCLSAPLCAQATHLVGPGGLPQIRDALAIAAAGDTVLVQPGLYAHFRVERPVTIRALVPGTVTVAYDPAFAPPSCQGFCWLLEGPTQFAVPSGDVHVVGIDFAPNLYQSPVIGVAHRVLVSSGVVTFDQCSLQSQATALTVSSARAHLMDCLLQSVGSQNATHGLFAQQADVTAVGCAFVGASPAGTALPGHGAQLVGTSLQASDCSFDGGVNGAGTLGRAALDVDGQNRVWIGDCTLTGGGGACAITGEPLNGHIARSVLSTTGATCGAIDTGSVIGVERPSPLVNGATFTMDVHTEPSTLVAIHASPDLGQTALPGLFEPLLHLDLSAYFLAGIYVSDGNGDVAAAWSLPAGLYVGTTLWLEPIALVPGQPILVGPVVGGVIR